MATNLPRPWTAGYWIFRKLLSQDNLGLDKRRIQGEVAGRKDEAWGPALAHSEVDLGGGVRLGDELVGPLVEKPYAVGRSDPEHELVALGKDLQALAPGAVQAGEPGQLSRRGR